MMEERMNSPREAPAPPRPPARERAWIRQLAQFPTLGELKRSSFWKTHGDEILGLLRRVQSGIFVGPSAEPMDAERVRIVHWNIERGKNFSAILHNLERHPDLKDPDIILLNEVDVGMARSGNRHTARELAETLGLSWTFSPSYLELTKGIREELLVAGENEDSLHGLAVLMRGEPVRVERVELPEIFDTFDFMEKRFGARTGLLAQLGPEWGHLVLAITHLEVRDTPQGRRRQLAALLHAVDEALERWGIPDAPVLLAGDLNTHTFSRGTVLRNARVVGRLLATPLERLAGELTEPWRDGREPLFEALEQYRFLYERLNDRSPTVSILLRGVEEAEGLPAFLRRWISRAAALGERVLPMRLDWFAARGFERPLADGHCRFTVKRARTILPQAVDGKIPSDHLPLLLELGLPCD
jgi:endonuclease/exonuclease/phosphatase family metal-dependent hydrolase